MNPTVTEIVAIGGAVVAVASALANVFPPNTIAYRVLHWLALNGPAIQNAINAASGKPKA